MEGAQQEYNYEAERRKLKLSPLATCVLLLKTTVGVGIFTYQYAYAKCGFVLGSLLSWMVFFMVVYGMYRLIELCDLIEEVETQKKKLLAVPPVVQPDKQPVELKDQKSTVEEGTEAALNLEVKEVDIYEVDSATERFQVITYHRRAR